MASRLPCCSGDVAGDPSESRESAGALQRPKAAEVERKGGKKGRKGREERKGGNEESGTREWQFDVFVLFSGLVLVLSDLGRQAGFAESYES